SIRITHNMFSALKIENIIKELRYFRVSLSKPQYGHFIVYIFGLIIKEKTKKNIMVLSGLRIGERCQSSLNRFLTSPKWSRYTINNKRKRLLIKRPKGILILDDTLIEKIGNKIEGVGRLKDFVKKRSLWCHCIVSTYLVNEHEKHPLDFRIYLKEEIAQKLKKPFKTKITLASELILEAYKTIEIDFVVMDAWYFANDLIKQFKVLGIDWITRAKSNRLVRYNDQWISLNTLTTKIPRICYSRRWIKTNEGIEYYYVYSIVLQMKKVGKVKIVISYKDLYDCDDKPYFLVTNLIDLTPKEIIENYKKRGLIEAFYRDTKQHLGLGDYQMRKLEGVVTHLHLVFLAYSLLENARLDLESKIMDTLKTVGDLCRAVKELLLDHILYLTSNTILTNQTFAYKCLLG
ncbi:MAG: IS701 family transposase, partial [Methanosarcinales archaeon]